jgi:hypothetical protein
VGLEQVPFSLMRINEELLETKLSVPVLKIEIIDVGGFSSLIT